MLPILTNTQIREVERAFMVSSSVTPLELMEQAARQCTDRLLRDIAQGEFGPATTFVVVVGMGNNGGDGLVIARLLTAAGISVRVLRVLHKEERSLEHRVDHLELLKIGVPCVDIADPLGEVELFGNEVVIDCLLGTGVSRPPTGLLRNVIRNLNNSGRSIVSIDLPSGLVEPGSDQPFDPESCIRADRTFTFEVPRPALLLAGTGPFAGRWELVPIGLDPELLGASARFGEWVEATDVRDHLMQRPRFSHKGTFGHALLIAGSKGMFGAAVLATKACLRSGVGLVSAHVPDKLATTMHLAAPEALCSIDHSPDHVAQLPLLEQFSAVAIGPGLGSHPESSTVVDTLLSSVEVPLVLDADALNILANNPGWFRHLSKNTVLTPHPKEMDRLLSSPSISGFERLERTREFALEHGCIVVLKGAYTAICLMDGNVQFNSTGNAGMAKGGSGDVLTGLLTGFLAQGYTPHHAALIAVHLHGSAGDLAATALGMDAMHAGDLIEYLPQAWKMLREN
ncbi:MAG: NAD(P)H-hydrate dehydratase [Flavobacteriales bacterium]|nr:NAD(P)H-hydrate dehydratase [Flavobacteriales bacterium]